MAELRTNDPAVTGLKARMLLALHNNKRNALDFAIEGEIEASAEEGSGLPFEGLALSIVRDLLDQMGTTAPLPTTA